MLARVWLCQTRISTKTQLPWWATTSADRGARAAAERGLARRGAQTHTRGAHAALLRAQKEAERLVQAANGHVLRTCVLRPAGVHGIGDKVSTCVGARTERAGRVPHHLLNRGDVHATPHQGGQRDARVRSPDRSW